MLRRASFGLVAVVAFVGTVWGCGSDISTFSTGGGTPGTGGSGGQGHGGHGTGADATGGSSQGGSTASTTPGSGGGNSGSSNGGGPGSGGAGPGSGGAGPGSGGAGPGASSGGPGASTGTGGNMCPGFGDMCSNCASQNCNQDYCRCYGNVACINLAICYQGCAVGSATCYQGCETMYPDGISNFFLVENCAFGACSTQCPGAFALTTCQQCSFTNCDTEANACIADAGCHAIVDCINACTTDPCRQACLLNRPAGSVTKAITLANCSSTNCASVCP